MVSSAVDLELAELLATLERIRRDYGSDPEYRQLRDALPADWPI